MSDLDVSDRSGAAYESISVLIRAAATGSRKDFEAQTTKLVEAGEPTSWDAYQASLYAIPALIKSLLGRTRTRHELADLAKSNAPAVAEVISANIDHVRGIYQAVYGDRPSELIEDSYTFMLVGAAVAGVTLGPRASEALDVVRDRALGWLTRRL